MLYIYISWRSLSHYSGGSVTDSGSTMVEDIDLAAVVGATITTVGPPVMAVRWSKKPICRQSPKPLFWLFHLFGHWRRFLKPLFYQSTYRWVTIWQYSGRRDQFGGVCWIHYFGGSAVGPPPQAAPLAEPPVLVIYLKYKFKLKKYDY